jgi:TonB family protein
MTKRLVRLTLMLSGERGRLYEVPLLFAFYFVVCALVVPYVTPRRGAGSLLALGALVLLGLGLSALLGAAVSPRVKLLGVPAAIAAFVLVSLLTAPLLLSPRWGALALVILPAQVWVAFRTELALAGVRERRERERGAGPAVRSLFSLAVLAATAAPAAAADVTALPLEIRAARPQVPAAYQEAPPPAYPAAAREQGLEGVVVLNVEVLATGRVGEVQVAVSSGARVLDETAVAAVRGWTFTPARQGGRAVDSLVEVPVRFALSRR